MILPEGPAGDSAYELWVTEVNNGNIDWPKDRTDVNNFFLYLKGEDGQDGKSAYEIWVEEVEKVVEKPVETVVTIGLAELFDQIYFDFDSYQISSLSEETLDKIAETFLKDTSRHYLITGQTDSRGSDAFNQELSENRAREVVKALIKRDVPADMLKWRGIGKKIAIVDPSASDNARRGDRKITVELIANMEYWNNIPGANSH